MKRNYNKAIVHFEKSLVATKVLTGAKDDLIAEIYLNLGVAHDSANNFPKAIKCFDLCIECERAISSKAFICKGRALSKFGMYDGALTCLSIALDIGGNSREEADILVAKGQLLDLMDNNAPAMDCYLSALSMYRKLPSNDEVVASVCQEIANSHLRKGRFDAAQEFAKEAFDM